MSNPFAESDDEHTQDNEILEGFLCPVCHKDLKSLLFLSGHFEREHSEEEDALKSIFNIFSKAKKKIGLNFDGGDTAAVDLSGNFEKNASISASGGSSAAATSNARTRMNVFNFMERQDVGAECGHFEYFQTMRNPRLERYASETNKLIIRLHKLLKDMPRDPVQRKQHEQMTVSWLDGKSVKLCPSCARSFHIARRQHHCRLCGSIMCNDCSKFLPMDMALNLASLTMNRSETLQQTQEEDETQQQIALRCCNHCLWLLETRQEMHESRTCRPPITQHYADIQQLRKDVTPDLEMYVKMVNSLCDGESIFTVADASALRCKIGQIAEAIDARSKRIMSLPSEPGSRVESLKKSIRLSCVQIIKEQMLSLPPIPDEMEVRKIQERKRVEAEQRIETERRMALEAYERYGLSGTTNTSLQNRSNAASAYGSDLRSLDNWSAHQVSAGGSVPNDDPLVEQINIIKGYIKQARKEMNFSVVETLEMNLRELQHEFYERQRAAAATTDSAPPSTK